MNLRNNLANRNFSDLLIAMFKNYRTARVISGVICLILGVLALLGAYQITKVDGNYAEAVKGVASFYPKKLIELDWLTLASLAVAVLALWISIKALRGAEKTAKDQLRAYVAVSKIDVKYSSNDNPILHILYDNSGQTPAASMEIAAKTDFISKSQFPFADVQELSNFVAISPIGANKHGIRYPLESLEFGDELDKVPRSPHSSKAFVIYGRIRYRTVFDEIYVSDFLFCMNKPTAGDEHPFRQVHSDVLKVYHRSKKRS